MSVDFAIQIALRARFIATPDITQHVPADFIVDRSSLPPLDPSIVLGEAQIVDEGDSVKRDRVRVYSTVHIWKREESLMTVRQVGWGIRSALRRGPLDLGPGFQCADCFVSSQRNLRDPDGMTAHAVVTIETLVKVLA
ncbi:hypothetical protein QE369_001198 [Agrobacterium larrymoorei]|uniref:DUF3168 domain-containing protein n=1 Tax=Agrobacterium larrymoorei TaxID=160699 RepID=A0AAJ2EQB0_9HYPH|nr:DUF3168 domain-containing protein [Agrobacterium larrymoorei]MDR6101020.1 hypothetical protein [Agrobacterium larrymoorei]